MHIPSLGNAWALCMLAEVEVRHSAYLPADWPTSRLPPVGPSFHFVCQPAAIFDYRS